MNLQIQNNRTCSILMAIAGILIFSGTIAAQQGTPSQKIEEFIGEADEEDMKARLDIFAIKLKDQPGAQAHIILYRTRAERFPVDAITAKDLKEYLIRRGIDRKRIITVDGGMTGCFLYELWIVPPGALPPERRFTYQYSQNYSVDPKPASKVKQRRRR